MQRLVIDIPDSKVDFFLELVHNLGIKKVEKLSKQQKEFVEAVKTSLTEVELHQQGKITLQSAKDFLDKL